MTRIRILTLGAAMIVVTLASGGTDSLAQAKSPEASSVFPGEAWVPIDPARLGMSAKKLKQAKQYFEKIGGDACVVIKGGHLVASWGDVSKPIANRSFRKSYLNSLLGIEFGSGRVPLDATLEKLEIDDVGGLTETERQARLRDLLSASSGVFHEAAFESKEQKGARPPRGSFAPGAFFY